MKKILIFLFIWTNFVYGADNEYLKKADKYFKEGKFSLAEIFYKKVIKSEPDSFKANLNLGKIYFYQDDFKKALKYLNTANDIKSDLKTKFLIANTYVMLNKPEIAMTYYSNIIKSKPDYSDVYLNAGLVSFKKLYNKKLTIYFWENFLKLRPDDKQASNIRKALSYLKDPDFKLQPPAESVAAGGKQTSGTAGGTSSASAGTSGSSSSNVNPLDAIKIKGKDIISKSETRYKIKDKKMITTD